MEEPTEIELELKRRLGQLTDHLIQKQAQVRPNIHNGTSLCLTLVLPLINYCLATR